MLTASVTSTGDETPTGTITFTADDQTLGTAPLVDGVATYRLAGDQAAGTYQVVADYSGDDNSAASQSDAVEVKVKQATSRTWLRLSNHVYRHGATKPPKATAMLHLNTGAKAQGDVVFRIDGEEVAQVEVEDGQATWQLPADVETGLHRITAEYSGNSNINGSESNKQLFFVLQ